MSSSAKDEFYQIETPKGTVQAFYELEVLLEYFIYNVKIGRAVAYRIRPLLTKALDRVRVRRTPMNIFNI
ncbi:Protein of unknown function [Cotesia congregata]|uniref:Uncharacterized protein n=1 Tax=Cotesia congregata TaxID=51543 RepID=A0A8J2H6D1_COTCN|nr:Protein of unknown function [Cotesia congregata]